MSHEDKNIPEGWEETYLGLKDLEVLNGYAFKSKDFVLSKIDETYLPVLKIKNVANGDANHNDVVFHQFDNKTEKFIIQKEDILIALTGNHPFAKSQVVGGVSKYRLDHKALLNQRVAKLKAKNDNILNNDFIYYFFKWEKIQFHIGNQSTGSASQANISKSDILNIPIILPSVQEQKAIADILTAFDDKIENLRNQNNTLEQTAQTIFTEWFGKYQLEDELPEGWRVGNLNEFIQSSIGGDYGKEDITDYFNVKTICLRGTDLPDMKVGIPKKAPIRFLKASKLEKCQLIDGDIVIEISGGTENQSTGRVMYINEVIIENSEFPMTCVNFCRIIRPINPEYSYFIYSVFDYLYNRKVMFNWENGTTGIKNLNLNSMLANFDLSLPESNTKIIEFNAVVKPFFIKIQTNNKQIQSLAQTRDALLPKLMSGELRVKL